MRKYHLKSTIGGIVVLVWLFRVVSFATDLSIMKVGNGDGRITDNHQQIRCGERCHGQYPEGTVVQLTIEPDYQSLHIGWLVNERPHEGQILTLTHDTVVKVIFERNPALTYRIIWYNVGAKQNAYIALNELAVFLRGTERWNDLTGYQFTREIQAIRRRFHPRAVVSTRYGYDVAILECPEILSYEEWSHRMARVNEFRAVSHVGPVVYLDPDVPESRQIPTDEIFVKFPQKTSLDQVREIEQRYQLTRIETIDALSNAFTYKTSDPLAGLDIVNALYESRGVERAYPKTIEYYLPD